VRVAAPALRRGQRRRPARRHVRRVAAIAPLGAARPRPADRRAARRPARRAAQRGTQARRGGPPRPRPARRADRPGRPGGSAHRRAPRVTDPDRRRP
jgi:hypothetical protein